TCPVRLPNKKHETGLGRAKDKKGAMILRTSKITSPQVVAHLGHALGNNPRTEPEPQHLPQTAVPPRLKPSRNRQESG
ncbi:MAG: hypothetical protein KDA84_14010, partial [Planctomycetaceae bacterium]|nr:hypothetical protein [Planctomycetaceae bacterium]